MLRLSVAQKYMLLAYLGSSPQGRRNDPERFYSFNDLQLQIHQCGHSSLLRYLYRSNNIPMAVFNRKSPNQKQWELGGR